MITIKRHSNWILCALALSFALAFSPPLQTQLILHIQNRQKASQTQIMDLTKRLDQYKADETKAKALKQELSSTDIEALIRPHDPEQIKAQINSALQKHALIPNTLIFGPAEPSDGEKIASDITGLVRYQMSIETDAPSDTDIFSFLSSLSTFGGLFELSSIQITRLHQTGDHRRTPAPLNLHVRIDGLWTMNAPNASQTAGTP